MELLPIFLQQPETSPAALDSPGSRKAETRSVEKNTAHEVGKDKKLKEAAQEFEAIFVAQLLSAMRESTTQTDFLGGQSTTMKIFNGMLDEQYALEMAKSGQIGLAEMLIEQLTGANASQQSVEGAQNLSISDIPVSIENISQAAFIESLGTGNLAQLQRLQAELLLANQLLNTQTTQANSSSPRSQLPAFELPSSAQEVQINPSKTFLLNLNQIRDLDPANLAALMSSMQANGTENEAPARLLSSEQVLIQIINKIRPALGAGGHEAIINLEPPTLGRMHIRLVLLEDGMLVARIHVRNGMVSEIVRGNLSQLRNALSEQGIQIDSFHVTSGDTGAQGTSTWQNSLFGDWQENIQHRFRGPQDSGRTESSANGDADVKPVEAQSPSDLSYSINYLV